MGTLQSSFLLGKWLPSLPNHNRLTESVKVFDWRTESVEVSDWLTESVEVSDWLTESVEVSDWLTESVEGSGVLSLPYLQFAVQEVCNPRAEVIGRDFRELGHKLLHVRPHGDDPSGGRIILSDLEELGDSV